jgi:hypothetical protein
MANRVLGPAWSWLVDQVIERWPQLLAWFVVTGGMGYLAFVSDFLQPYAPFSWGATALLALLILAIIYYVYGAARQKVILAEYTKKKNDAFGVNVMSPTHDHEQIELTQFYHPYMRATENVRFSDCDLLGPSFVYLDGCAIHSGHFGDCDVVIARPDRPIHGAVHLRGCHFIRCHFYRVTLLLTHDAYEQLPLPIKSGLSVISDGRVGDV